MHYLIYDLETEPNEVEWEPPKDRPDAFRPPSLQKIVCNAGMEIEISNKHVRCTWIGTFGKDDDERSKIEEFIDKVMDKKKAPIVVDFNGRRFDIPVILYRCMHYGIPFPYIFNKDFEYRFAWNDHLDLADRLSGYGAAPVMKLSHIAQTIGLPGKFGVDGSQVFELAKKGDYKTINAYGQCDVIQTAFVLLRLLVVADRLSIVDHNNLIHSIRSKAGEKKEPMIQELLSLIDFDKLAIEIRNKDDDYSQVGLFEEDEEGYDPEIPF
jgi:predicted PolB exonuclease-like 3'-5' exonuclease